MAIALDRAHLIVYTIDVEIEFDDAKDVANRAKHGVPLAFGVAVLGDERRLVLPSHRPIDGEDRFKAVGEIDGVLWTAVFVRRGSATRFISVRRSNDGERRAYRA